MHVRTAIETLSRSTADSMEFLMKNGHPEFLDAAATIEFIRIFDKLWDVFNTYRIKSDEKNIFKSAPPLTPPLTPFPSLRTYKRVKSTDGQVQAMVTSTPITPNRTATRIILDRLGISDVSQSSSINLSGNDAEQINNIDLPEHVDKNDQHTLSIDFSSVPGSL